MVSFIVCFILGYVDTFAFPVIIASLMWIRRTI